MFISALRGFNENYATFPEKLDKMGDTGWPAREDPQLSPPRRFALPRTRAFGGLVLLSNLIKGRIVAMGRSRCSSWPWLVYSYQVG